MKVSVPYPYADPHTVPVMAVCQFDKHGHGVSELSSTNNTKQYVTRIK